MDKVLAVIPARGGSKGIYKKNIRDVGGKPLIYWQIQNGLKSNADKVVVSTDDKEIADIASQWCGVIMRPPEISGDDSKTEDALLHALNSIPADIVVILQPTSPLTKVEDINICIALVKERYDSAACFVDDYGFFADDLHELMKRPMRQDKKPRIRETGNCWVTRTSVLRKTTHRFGGNVGIHIVAPETALEIDNETDWRLVESLLPHQYYRMRSGEDTYEEGYWGVITDPDGNVRDRKREGLFHNARHKDKIDYINSLPPGKLLDVGCGMGFLLAAISDTWEKHGVDMSEYAYQYSRNRGDIYCGKIEDAPYESNYFDVLVLSHIIEHVESPELLINKCRRILKPNGKLIVETPDFDCAVAKAFGENFRLLKDKGHIRLFGLLGLHRMLLDSMFEVEKLEMPFIDTPYCVPANIERLKDRDKVSPPFLGNVITFYCYKK